MTLFRRALALLAMICLLSVTLVSAQGGPYEPTYESVSKHQVPEWYDNAKLGIFIHWGVYSVPGWAPITGELGEVLAEHGWEYWFAHNPYAEWYANSMRVEGSATQQHHIETYGADFDYRDFVPMFNEQIAAWDPDEWATLFADVGAQYVVLTTKHHDGFLLWPSETPNPFVEDYHASRDIVGELTEAVRAHGMRMGLYYSGGLDWTFKDLVIQDITDLFTAIPQEPEYAEYALSHWMELIDRYQPSVLWDDIGFPASVDLNALFAHYYNTIPEGVVNNRFNMNPEAEVHYDFTTPEYAVLEDIREEKWESTRGIGFSFGYNQNEDVETFLSSEELIRSFVDIVSKNGNLLLNVGPMADGTIPPGQLERLVALGAWLDVNGEAIFGSRPWERAEAVTDGAIPVRFTQKDDVLYAILLDTPVGESVTIEDLDLSGMAAVELLGHEGALEWQQNDGSVTIMLPEMLPDAPAHTFKFIR